MALGVDPKDHVTYTHSAMDFQIPQSKGPQMRNGGSPCGLTSLSTFQTELINYDPKAQNVLLRTSVHSVKIWLEP